MSNHSNEIAHQTISTKDEQTVVPAGTSGMYGTVQTSFFFHLSQRNSKTLLFKKQPELTFLIFRNDNQSRIHAVCQSLLRTTNVPTT